MSTSLGSLCNAGLGSLESLLKVPSETKYMVYIGVAMIGLVLLMVIGTMCISVSTGQTNLNELANTATRII